MESKVERKIVGFEETLVVVRYLDGGKKKHDYHLSNAARETPLAELARVAKAEHRIEGESSLISTLISSRSTRLLHSMGL